MTTTLPENEAERRAQLRALKAPELPEDQAFDDLVQMAAGLCHVPVAAINLLDEDRLRSRAVVGVPPREGPREEFICGTTIAEDSGLLVVQDTRSDPGLARLPGVVRSGLRSYAGATIVTAAGDALGTVCVADREPRVFAARELENLRALARQTASLLELRAANDRLWDLAEHWSDLSTIEELTGLWNRRGCVAALERVIAQQTRGASPSAVIMADVDRLKHVNDHYGHLAGDVLLRTVAGRLSHSTREGDLVCRWGGDEFVIICPGPQSEAGLRSLVEKLTRAVARPLRLVDGESYVPSASFGFTLTRSEDEPDQVLLRADQAMYARKHARSDRPRLRG